MTSLQTFSTLLVLCAAPLAAQPAAPAPLRLNLKRAVEIATAPQTGSARVQVARELSRQAETRAAQARSALLPTIESQISEQSQTRNLQAVGLRVQLPIPGFTFPNFVGPFTVFDIRASATQSVFDWSSIRRYQSSKAGVSAARAELDAAGEQVAAQVARAYTAVLRAEADLEAARANVALAQAVLKQAENLKNAGTGTGIEVTRARVQLSNERQRQLVSENERRRTRLQLLRAMNLPLDTEFDLDDALAYRPVDPATLEKAAAKALQARADLEAQRQRESTAKLAYSATRSERLPSLAAFGDYGAIGTGVNQALPTRTVGVALRIPIFDGGRRDARRAESASQLRAEEVRTRDVHQQIALEVRLALDAYHSAEQEVEVAKEGLSLSESEFNQARRRYDAGVATSLEVTDAQTRLARARDNQIIALFHHAQARIDLSQATGTLRQEME